MKKKILVEHIISDIYLRFDPPKHQKNCLLPSKKGGQLLQHNSHPADLANLIQTMLIRYVYMIYKRKSSP